MAMPTVYTAFVAASLSLVVAALIDDAPLPA